MSRRTVISVLCVMPGLLVLSGTASGGEGQDEKIRVAVVGDSLSSQDRWPGRLAKHLGDGYEVKAFTANGLTVIPNVYRQIWNRYEYRHGLDYNPNIVLLAFGANAGKEKPGAWRMKERFIGGYKRLIALYERLGTKPKIYLLLPTWPDADFYGIYEKTVKEEVMPTMQQIAKDTGVNFIDVNAPLKGRGDVMGEDHVYSTDTGNEVIARAVYTGLTGKKLPAVPVQEQEAEPEEEPAGPPLPEPVKTMAVGDVVELTPADVANPKGDGPDGKGNTPDDTWQFWFELAHARQAFHRLSLATATMSAEQRQKGIPGKVDGPIAGNLPNPDDTEGWIFSTDWDGGYEGFWGDRK
ncbi:MAG: GDSL-type esterase/lipase family protein, partial [Planctomycetota bacterium]